ncbi:MAG: thioesterase family protein [Acidimicrobiales bacterium]|jgi:acyl-CoA thioesterase
MDTPFAATTRTSPSATRAGRYLGRIDESWNLNPLPQGGVVTALAARAMSAELAGGGHGLRSLHTTFVAPVAHGPVEVDVEILRRGRSMSHARAEVRNPGSAHGHVTTAVFGSPRRGFEFTDLDPPSGFVPLSEARSFRGPLPAGVEGFAPNPFWDSRMEGRAALGHAPWDDYVPDRAEHASWYRLDDPPLTDAGTLDPLALIVCADTMPGAVAEKIGPGERRGWFGPSVDLTFHLLDECRSEWVLAHNRARHAGDGYASVDMALWDLGTTGTDPARLVAYATQLCFFSFAT